MRGNPIRYRDPTGHALAGSTTATATATATPSSGGQGVPKPTPAPRPASGGQGASGGAPGGGDTNNTGISVGAAASDKGSLYNSISKGIHLGLDVLGFIPGFGIIFDGINTAYYLGEVLAGAGEATWADVAMSGLAMVPLVGDAAAGAKIGRKIGKEALEHMDDAAKAAEALKGAEKAAEGGGALGRRGRQKRLRELADDDKLGSADRGWLEQEKNLVEKGKRKKIRNPPGKDLAHERGREAAKGYDYEHSNLQDRDLHQLQHKYDDFGRANSERPIHTE